MNGSARGRPRKRVHQKAPVDSFHLLLVVPDLLIRIRPSSAVKVAERNSTPLQVVTALQIVLDLDMHDDRLDC